MKDLLIVVLLAAGVGAITFFFDKYLWSGSPYFVIGALISLIFSYKRGKGKLT